MNTTLKLTDTQIARLDALVDRDNPARSNRSQVIRTILMAGLPTFEAEQRNSEVST